MSEIKEDINKDKKETYDRTFSVRITNSQYEKCHDNPEVKAMIQKYIRMCLDSL